MEIGPAGLLAQSRQSRTEPGAQGAGITANAREYRKPPWQVGSDKSRTVDQVSIHAVVSSGHHARRELAAAAGSRGRAIERTQQTSLQQTASLDHGVDGAMWIPKHGYVVEWVRVQNEQIGESPRGHDAQFPFLSE